MLFSENNSPMEKFLQSNFKRESRERNISDQRAFEMKTIHVFLTNKFPESLNQLWQVGH